MAKSQILREGSLKITILGTSAVYPGAGEACSGFLVEEGNVKLLVDCGTGILSNLQKYSNLCDISDMVISHMHADHFFDLVPYRYALRYGLENADCKPRLYLPPGGIKILHHVVDSFAESDTFFSDVMEVSEYYPGRPLSLGNLLIEFVPVYHYIPTWAISIVTSKKLAYSAGSGMCPGLLQVAKDADLFICNIGACLANRKTDNWGHLRPSQAGKLARDAGVGRLLLSHLWPECNRTAAVADAAEIFNGSVELAKACFTYNL